MSFYMLKGIENGHVYKSSVHKQLRPLRMYKVFSQNLGLEKRRSHLLLVYIKVNCMKQSPNFFLRIRIYNRRIHPCVLL